MTILYIDEDHDDQELFMQCVDTICPANKLLTASSGEEALNVLQDHRPDYIFLDDHMHKMSGREFLEELKRQIADFTIPVIVFTTYLPEKSKREFIDLGVKHFLTKPTDFKSICDLVGGVLVGHNQSVK
jgi:CheY-like chemotaxis protein